MSLIKTSTYVFTIFFGGIVRASIFFVPRFFSRKDECADNGLTMGKKVFFRVFYRFHDRTRHVMPRYVSFCQFSIAQNDCPIASASVRPNCLVRSTSNVSRNIVVRVSKGVHTIYVNVGGFARGKMGVPLCVIVVQ